MSSQKSIGIKEPFKFIEIPLNKFKEEALPYHKQLFEQHKNAVDLYMFQKNTQQLTQEIRDKKRNVRQLKDLLYELDTLRAKVFDEDLDKFDDRTFALRRSISSIMKEYTAMQKSTSAFIESQNEINENIENESPFLGAEQIQVHETAERLKLEQSKDKLERVETLNSDVQGLHEIYKELNTMVSNQRETVTTIESNVVITQENVDQGLLYLIKTSKLKAATYPVTGAVLGGLLGGPLGFLAGAKVGGLAAIGCGLAGYTGGKLIKTHHDKEAECDVKSDKDESQPQHEVVKKDI